MSHGLSEQRSQANYSMFPSGEPCLSDYCLTFSASCYDAVNVEKCDRLISHKPMHALFIFDKVCGGSACIAEKNVQLP